MDTSESKFLIILRELEIKDQYGTELLSNIILHTAKSLDIKQPQLYSMLKTMTNSRLVQSYWQDSDIGGKRHYYKITELGKKRLITAPTIIEIIKDINLKRYQNIKSQIAPIDIASDNKTHTIDEITSYEVNKQNAELISDKKSINMVEKTFLRAISPIDCSPEQPKIPMQPSFENIEDKTLNTIPIKMKEHAVKRTDYIDYSTNEKNILRKKLFRNILIKNYSSLSVFIVFIGLAFSLCLSMSDASTLLIMTAFSLCLVIFSFVVNMSQLEKIKMKIYETGYSFSIRKNIIYSCSLSAILFSLFLVLYFSFQASFTSQIFIGAALLSSIPIIDYLLNMMLIYPICKKLS